MRAIKKKARTETDLVNIVEWRREGERYFALVRRPEGGRWLWCSLFIPAINVNFIGLLAGLYEFPSSENIDEDKKDLLDISHSILDNLLASPPPRYMSSNRKIALSANDDDQLRITDIRHIGDTQHIFSHIKKTYRISSIVLQGGPTPPMLSNCSGPQSKRRKVRDNGPDGIGTHMRWVPEEDVVHAK